MTDLSSDPCPLTAAAARRGAQLILYLVPHERRAAFEAAGWTVAHDLRPWHHACYAVLMERQARPGERAEALLEELARIGDGEARR